MNRKSLLWSFILIMTLVLAGCGGQTAGNTAGVTEDTGQTTAADNSSAQDANDTNAAGGPSITSNTDGSFVVKSAWGETTLPSSPNKIVALHFSFTDELVSLGVTPVGIAGSYNAEVLGYLKDKVENYTFVGNHQQPNLEVISSLQPDLIIANADVHGAIRDDLEKIAPTIALYTNGYGDMEQNFAVLGTLLGKEKEHDQVMNDLNQNIEQTHSQMNGTPKVMVVKVLEKNFYIWMKTSYIATLLENIGAEYSFDETKSNQQQTPGKIDVADVDLETLVQENPDYLVIYGAQADLDKWMGNSSFQSINAVKNNHVLVVNDEVWALGKGPLSGAEILKEALPFFTK
ncbi:ABC transporter substrate-binding protein [Paenibacillus sp. SZ31]|uniref:ABC transporter substrate-binding protein n=1 Tax=Paenibacillus sp. SZ31 TaxID=2725555 RepID=UPI00146D114E|nr:ABC transporter substrate-binding protein [Paenibacillus sp. SZ31]NMI03140.1 ABC transporter substrate-binding protein [Paenibacillus sp. SZ31]